MLVCQPTLSSLLRGMPTHRLALPSASVTPSCPQTQTHRPRSKLSNNATYNRLLFLSHEMFTVLRSVLAPHWLAKVNVGFLFQLSWLKASSQFYDFPPWRRMKRIFMREQLCEQRLEIKETVVEMYCAQLPHQLKATWPVVMALQAAEVLQNTTLMIKLYTQTVIQTMSHNRFSLPFRPFPKLWIRY